MVRRPAVPSMKSRVVSVLPLQNGTFAARRSYAQRARLILLGFVGFMLAESGRLRLKLSINAKTLGRNWEGMGTPPFPPVDKR